MLLFSEKWRSPTICLLPNILHWKLFNPTSTFVFVQGFQFHNDSSIHSVASHNDQMKATFVGLQTCIIDRDVNDLEPATCVYVGEKLLCNNN